MSKAAGVLRIIGASFRNHLKFVVTERTFFINSLITPLGLSVLFYFVYAGHPARQVIVAIIKAGLLGLWGANLWGASFILQGENRLGTIDYLLVTPHSIYPVLIGKALAVTLASNLSVVVSLFWAEILVGHVQRYLRILPVVVNLLACTYSFSSIGLMVGVFFISFREPEILMQFFTYPIYLLSGIAVPVAFFPAMLRFVSFFIPLYWAQETMGRLAQGGSLGMGPVIQVAVGTCFLVGAYFVLGKVEKRARWIGSFSRY